MGTAGSELEMSRDYAIEKMREACYQTLIRFQISCFHHDGVNKRNE